MRFNAFLMIKDAKKFVKDNMPKNQKEIAYQKIRNKIVSGALKPGQPITEELISADLKMSRTPVREALIRLQSEDLISIIERKGAIVKEITPKDVVEVFQIRLLIEPYATKVCVEFVDKVVLEKIKQYLGQLLKTPKSKDAFLKHEKGLNEIDDLHNLIIKSSGNRRLVNLFYTLHGQILRVIFLERRIPGRLEQSIQEHLKIVSALLDGDGDTAADCMKEHLESNMADLIDVKNYNYLYEEV